MASLLRKVQTLISANMHALVDSALKANSLAVFDQYVREIEDNLENLEDAVATVGGDLKTMRRKRDDKAEEAARLDRNIDIFLREGKEDLALAAQSKLNSVNRLVQDYDGMIERQDVEFQNLQGARLKLEAKLTEVKQEREELQVLLDLARSKELTAKTIKSLDDLMDADDADVSRVAEGIRARLDQASARSEMMADGLDAQMDEVLEKSALEAQLAERKSRLGLGQ
jgi:phage shock protein A